MSDIKVAWNRRVREMEAKMTVFVCCLFVWAFLQVSHQNPTNHWTLLPHILVVEVDGTEGQQPLSCLELPDELMRRDIKNGDIFWKKNGWEEEQRGNIYLLQLEESLGGGNYTCHSKDGSLLNYTVVLIQEVEANRRILTKSDKEGYLKCSAQNYNGEFHCSWTWHSSRVGKVAFINVQRVSDTQCSVDESGQHWTCSSGQSNFSCSVDDSGHRIVCLEEQHCPYAEESQQIHITVYLRTEHFLLEIYSKRFYLSEIVKPDKVSIGKVNTTMIEWSYPTSWSSPYSYFPLIFEIAQLRRRCKKCDNPCPDSKATKTWTVPSTNICQFEVKHKVKAVCVRAKDALCNSKWSEWSYIRLRRHKKNKRQQSKT
ncbi:interleukin 12Ba precursor isoform X2 [Etheostoma spectabile]|uniref:interleukin-12 subunit beta isoform X2 n=1 Tax=Etheostoma spectabile TaxID=54343 RepID=UPI0013AF56D3|nr:interleukin-12 subunit beta-like isoform X2 [Etheostoma spectabile]XP_032384458.1 interleukin-12 subunit beta-like isoform X2 [Etheostoma spectabile]